MSNKAVLPEVPDYSLLLKILDMNPKQADLLAKNNKEVQARRELHKKSITAFAKYYFPHYIKLEPASWQKLLFSIFEAVYFDELGRPYWKVTEEQAAQLAKLHRKEFQDIPRQVDLLRALVLCAPREQGKSTLFARILVIWLVLFGYCRYVVIIRSSGDLASAFLRDTMVEFEDNQRLLADYGSLQGSVWKDGQYILKNGAALVAIGRGSSVRGLVYREKRPDLIICDDITTDQDKHNVQTLKKLYNWITSAVLGLGKNAVLLFLNTIFNSSDPQATFLSRIIEGDLIDWFGVRLSAEVVDGEIALWPEYWPLEACIRKRKEVGSSTYLVEYQSITVDDNTKIFRNEHMLYVPKTAIYAGDYEIAFGVDPNAEGSDDAAIAVLGRNRATGSYLTLDIWFKDYATIQEMVDNLVRLWRVWNPYIIGFEENGFQKVYQKLLQEILMPQHINLPFCGIASRMSKESGATMIQPFMENGSWQHSEHLKDSEAMRRVLAFPTRGINDGVVDALKLAYLVHNRGAGNPTGAAGKQRPSALPGLMGRYING